MALIVVTSLGGTALWQLHSDSRSQGLDATSSPPRQTPPPRDPRSYAVVQHPDPWQLAHFAPLRTFPEGLPAKVTEALGKPTYGMNRSLAQRISVTGPGTFWLVPANRHLCIVARRGAYVGTACTTTAAAIARGVAFVDIDAATRPPDFLTPR